LQTVNSLDSLSYKIEPNYQNAEIPLINYIITPDKNIIERLQKSGEKKIYIRTLKDSLNYKQ